MRNRFDRSPFLQRAPAVAAAFALLLSFLLPYVVHPEGGTQKGCLDAVRGLCAGLSIGLNLLSLRRRCMRPL